MLTTTMTSLVKLLGVLCTVLANYSKLTKTRNKHLQRTHSYTDLLTECCLICEKQALSVTGVSTDTDTVDKTASAISIVPSQRTG